MVLCLPVKLEHQTQSQSICKNWPQWTPNIMEGLNHVFFMHFLLENSLSWDKSTPINL